MMRCSLFCHLNEYLNGHQESTGVYFLESGGFHCFDGGVTHGRRTTMPKIPPRQPIWPYVWRSAALTAVFAGGVVWSRNVGQIWKPFGRYACILSFFHLSECLTIALVKPRSLKLDSFLLNHSPEYHIAALVSWIEFGLEGFFFPSIKEYTLISWLGLGLCLGGEVIRKMAMITAGSNFSHKVEFRKERGHTLVTHGVYSLWRHPSYVGWFYWSIGTQLILMNPFCSIGYAFASWSFFQSRIEEEERILVEFFGDDYREYMKKVPPGIPFLKLPEPEEMPVEEKEDEHDD